MICPHIGLSKMLNTKKQLYLTSLFQTCDTTEAIHAIHSNLLPHLEGGKNKNIWDVKIVNVIVIVKL